MCGICGMYDPRGADRNLVRTMADTLRHRGPDDDGYHLDGPVGLGFRRLSIIDLEHGAQPLSNEDGTVWIVFNGEIYNYRDLRTELQGRGHRFSTRTDTETIVHLWEEMGDRCVERLRGMFAFAIWDATTQTLFLARDRLGQKPLFYGHRDQRFLFGSEVKSLLQGAGVTGTLNEKALHEYLALRFVPAPSTLFEEISSLPPAHTLTFTDGSVSIRRYWDLDYRPKWEGDEQELIDRLEGLFRDAVQSHLVSDVEVGAFLSGGIDSSLMTAFMAHENGPGVPTFSIGSRVESFNELPMARLVADEFDTSHHEEVVEPDVLALLPEMVHHLDMPGDPIAACQYFAAKLAGRHVKVAISGDGGDELFAGYDRFAGLGWVSLYALIPGVLRRRMIGPALDLLSDSFAYKSTVSKLRWLQELSFHEGAARFAEATTYFRFNRERMNRLYGPKLRQLLTGCDPRHAVMEAFETAEADDVLDRMLHADITTRLPEHLLLLQDRMTMSQSLEGRSPMLDHHLVEFAARLPTDLKLRRTTLKYSLRKLAERHLPPEITDRPKQGFMFPIAEWLKDDLRIVSRELLQESCMAEAGLFRRAEMVKLLDEHEAGEVDHHHRIWMLLNLEIWYRHYMGGETVPDLVDHLRKKTFDRGGETGTTVRDTAVA